MKLITLSLIVAVLAFSGCQQPAGIPDALVTASIAAGTSAGLKLTIHDDAKRKTIAKYLNTYAGALRTITGNPTDEELTKQLMAFIPADINQQYPELGAFAVPLIVSTYRTAYTKYGNNTKALYQVLSDCATGIETGSAPFI